MHRLVIFPAVIFTLFSCSLEYETSVSDEFSESVPSSILYNVEQIQMKNGHPRVSFKAEEAKVWSEREETELFSIHFREYDENREIITSGDAAYVLVSDDNDAAISGGVSGYSSRNEASIDAENLSWTDEARSLRSEPETMVTLSLDEGTVLTGAGFAADFYTNEVEFSTRVSGVIETGRSEDEE